ncbi:hypothetical protein [Pasteurella sp. PK-2025]|uniref:hypothetical protein n=1 Tax=Pasteurella sp. PK-2025 TaxID=3413133 RepID=UPI003C75C5F1
MDNRDYNEKALDKMLEDMEMAELREATDWWDKNDQETERLLAQQEMELDRRLAEFEEEGHRYEEDMRKQCEDQAERFCEKIDRVREYFLRDTLARGYTPNTPTDISRNGKVMNVGEIQEAIDEARNQLDIVNGEIQLLIVNNTDFDECSRPREAYEKTRSEMSSHPDMLKLKAKAYDLYSEIDRLSSATPDGESEEPLQDYEYAGFGVLRDAIKRGYSAEAKADMRINGNKKTTLGDVENEIRKTWVELNKTKDKINSIRRKKLLDDGLFKEGGKFDKEGLDELMASPEVVALKVRYYDLHQDLWCLSTASPETCYESDRFDKFGDSSF